jgi:hypothetical protein
MGPGGAVGNAVKSPLYCRSLRSIASEAPALGMCSREPSRRLCWGEGTSRFRSENPRHLKQLQRHLALLLIWGALLLCRVSRKSWRRGSARSPHSTAPIFRGDQGIEGKETTPISIPGHRATHSELRNSSTRDHRRRALFQSARDSIRVSLRSARLQRLTKMNTSW